MSSSTAKLLRNIALPNDIEYVHTEAVILDVGSHSTRIGFAGDNAPRLNQRTCVLQKEYGSATCCFDKAYASAMSSEQTRGRGSNHSRSNDSHKSNARTRDHAAEKAYCCAAEDDGSSTVVMCRGAVQSWANWNHMMDAVNEMLQLSNAELSTPLLLTEKALVPFSQRRHMAELLFESHGLSALSFQPSPVLALYAAGLSTGVSVELGHEQCHVVPVFQGFPLFHATHRLDVGGLDLTQLFARQSPSRSQLAPASGSAVIPTRLVDVWAFLKEKYGRALPSSKYYEMATTATTPTRSKARRRSIKSSSSPPSPLYSEDRRGSLSATALDELQKPVEHVLPDGTRVVVGSERYRAAEALFSPSLLHDSAQHGSRDSTADAFTGRAATDAGSTAAAAAAPCRRSANRRSRDEQQQQQQHAYAQKACDEVQQLQTCSQTHGIHELIVSSVQRCDADLTPLLLNNIVLSGGSSLFAGLPERVAHEVQRLLQPSAARVVAEVDRRQAAFVGGSIIASLPAFQDFWVTRAQYDEEGATAVVRRCF